MVADVLVMKIILRFGMPLVIHSDQGREFENGLMKVCLVASKRERRLITRSRMGWWNGSIALV